MNQKCGLTAKAHYIATARLEKQIGLPIRPLVIWKNDKDTRKALHHTQVTSEPSWKVIWKNDQKYKESFTSYTSDFWAQLKRKYIVQFSEIKAILQIWH